MKRLKITIMALVFFLISGVCPTCYAHAQYLTIDEIGLGNLNYGMRMHLEERLNPIGYKLHKEKLAKIKQKKAEAKRKKLEEKKRLKEQKRREKEQKAKSINIVGDYAKMVYDGAIARGLDGNLAVAISKLETGHYKSNAFINYNNFGGLMCANGLMYFTTKEEGLNAFLNTLEHYRGMSVEEMGSIYCTDGSDWSGMVRSLMN